MESYSILWCLNFCFSWAIDIYSLFLTSVLELWKSSPLNLLYWWSCWGKNWFLFIFFFEIFLLTS